MTPRRVPVSQTVAHPEWWVEPGLSAALARLSEKQRLVVALLYGYQWSMSEVAALLDVSKGTVQSYADRGLKRLRRKLGVEL
jgi:RNA polymerase sigma factor (sigma-70 family)